jgi:hypothetical protein
MNNILQTNLDNLNLKAENLENIKQPNRIMEGRGNILVENDENDHLNEAEYFDNISLLLLMKNLVSLFLYFFGLFLYFIFIIIDVSGRYTIKHKPYGISLPY